jgi:hypothetical protein
MNDAYVSLVRAVERFLERCPVCLGDGIGDCDYDITAHDDGTESHDPINIKPCPLCSELRELAKTANIGEPSD